jgi:hypothetical protein
METERAYFERKCQELRLIADCLDPSHSTNSTPQTFDALVEAKFRLAAELKATCALTAWASTETSWYRGASLSSGPFSFEYRYQRADLAVSGPLPYPALDRVPAIEPRQLTYTCSGMAAVSAVLLALASCGSAGMVFLPGCYKETLEFASSAPGLRILGPAHAMRRRRGGPDSYVLWLDWPPGNRILGDPEACGGRIDLIVFDTTCFAAQSRRLVRFLNWARRARSPVILVRSHTKLDTLGIEYGRLGSALLLSFPEVPAAKLARFREIGQRLRDLVRLLGTTAVPAHFCPFTGSPACHALAARRSAAMLRNSRAMERQLTCRLGASAVRPYPHGMFTGLMLPQARSEAGVVAEAEGLAAAVRARGLPLRHAGSFGFDFPATEAFFDTGLDRWVLRLSAADLPHRLRQRMVDAICGWWAHRWRMPQAA